MRYLGDYAANALLYFCWESIATGGVIRVYKDNSVTQTVLGITDTRNFDGLTDIHCCTIDLSFDAFYSAGHDYAVVLAGAVVDGDSVNYLLAEFSIEHRSLAVVTDTTFIKNVLEGDTSIDTTTTPWNFVVKTKGTTTELIRKDLKDINDVNLGSISTVIGSATEPA